MNELRPSTVLPDHEFVDDGAGMCMQCGMRQGAVWHIAADYWERQHRHQEADRAGHP